MSTDPIRPLTKANSTNRKDWRYCALAVGVLCILAIPVVAQSCMPSPSCMNPQFNLSAYYGGQDITINECMDPNSPSCAWADAVMVPNLNDAANYFLACSLPANGNPIALCYYSGVPGPPENTPSCTLSQDGNAAQCNCYEINVNTPGATGKYSYSYVEITGILNQDLYNQTIADCPVGSDGTYSCLTLADVRAGTTKMQAPHLCAALTNQPNGIFPGADLISDFSEIGNSPNPPNKIPPPLTMPYACPVNPPPPGNNYAACMTAPCKHTGKIDPMTQLPLASCTCPTFDGPNQVGNPQIEGPPLLSCSPPPPYGPTVFPYVWSSAYIDVTGK